MTLSTRINSRDNVLIARVRRLLAGGAAYRRVGQVWLEGDHLLRAARARGVQLETVLVASSRANDAELADLMVGAGRIGVVDDKLWRELSSLESPAAVGALIAMPQTPSVERGTPSVVFDRVQDVGNVGSILRSAAAFGFGQIIALSGTAALWSAKVLRAGMGAHFGLRLVERATIDTVTQLQVPLLGTSSHAAERLGQMALDWPCAWVFGHEGQGIHAELAARCAHVLAIPQPGGEESLNVAAAAAICLYESACRRSIRAG
jgi:TrmH family RNA methyltransferase